LATLEAGGLVVPVAVEAGERGPARTRMRVTRAGRSAVERWLGTPVSHVRELRTHLLLQFRLLDRRGMGTTALAHAQLDQLGPILASLRDQMDATEGFDHLLAAWRYESADAAARVLEGVLAPGHRQAASAKRR
jgi:PadR family transcriptional regulator AphA